MFLWIMEKTSQEQKRWRNQLSRELSQNGAGYFFKQMIPIPEHIQTKLKAGEQVDLTLTSNAYNSATR